MVKETVNKVGRHLEILATRRIPLASSLDLLGRQAKSVEEMVVIEVIREVIKEEMLGYRYSKAS